MLPTRAPPRSPNSEAPSAEVEEPVYATHWAAGAERAYAQASVGVMRPVSAGGPGSACAKGPVCAAEPACATEPQRVKRRRRVAVPARAAFADERAGRDFAEGHASV
jgi:hypothetical protein